MAEDGVTSSSGLPPGYPAGFETDVVLADGATAHVRPIRPDDGPGILAFHAPPVTPEHLLPLLQPPPAA